MIALTCGAKWRRFLEPIGNSAGVRVPRIVTISELGTFNRGTTETRASGRHSNRCYGGCQGRIQDTFALVWFANKASVKESGLGVTARNFSALTVQGDSGPSGVSVFRGAPWRARVLRWEHRDSLSSLCRTRRERVVPNRCRTSGQKDGAQQKDLLRRESHAHRVEKLVVNAVPDADRLHCVATSTQISTDMFVTRSAVLGGIANWTQTSQPRLGCHLWPLRRRHRGKNQLIVSRRGSRLNAGGKECQASRVLSVEQASTAGGTKVDTWEAASASIGGGGCDRKRDFGKALSPKSLL